ncbi:hypothetical protein MTP99_007692 [Tenebrio molitor]|nr:hypothetical protein MTP99_007692 [Tenebrio molitor]CAH1366339.1 unnamed protein product [Tenebrio molitor]
MDMEKMLEEYRQAQRIRISRKLTNKAMAFVEFKKVQVQDGSGPIFKDVTMLVKKGTLPDPGIVVFYNKPANFNLMIVGSSFMFSDKLPCDNQLTIIFDGEEERREDISLTFATKELKDDCATALIHYLDLSNRSSPLV